MGRNDPFSMIEFAFFFSGGLAAVEASGRRSLTPLHVASPSFKLAEDT